MPKDRQLSIRFAPLITAAEMFPALEQLSLQTRSELLMSFRILDPDTRLRSSAARRRGLETWGELLAHVAAGGVKLRLLIADFDPIIASDLHRNAWRTAEHFAAILPKDAEVLCAQHEATPSSIWAKMLRPRINRELEKLRQDPPELLTPLQKKALDGEICLRPATLHQKFAISDGKAAIIGGMDINERRYDNEDHDVRPEDTWHDVSLQVSDRAVNDLRRHFSDCWDRAMQAGAESFGTGTTLPCETQPLVKPSRSSRGPRLLRTVSVAPDMPWTVGPRTEINEHEEAHLAAFESARDLVYLETQFFRHVPLARALARQARKNPSLQLILLLPSEPERVIFGGADGADARHAQALQLQCLQILRGAFADRMAVLTPAQTAPAPPGTPAPVEGAGIIYLHSKVTLVDDTLGIVGSANLNGRSMRWDTEASLQFHDAGQIRALRERLMGTWLRGKMPGIDTSQATEWNRLATEAAALPPAEREVMFLPWPEARNKRFARALPLLPANMF